MGVTIGFLTRHNPDQFDIVGISQSWHESSSKKYPTQTQVSANGTTSQVGKLNDAPAIKVNKPPPNKTYYMVDDDYFVSLYARVFIKNKKVD